MTRSRLRSASIAAVFVLAVTGACGGGSESDDAAPAETPTTAAAGAGASADTKSEAASSPETTAAPAKSGSSDPCRLLTSAEAEEALGKKVGPPSKEERDFPTGGTFSGCFYNAVDESSGPASLSASSLGKNIPKAEWEEAERSEGHEEVPGLGDLVFYNEDDGKMAALVDGEWLQVQMIGSNRFAEKKAILTEVIRNVMARA